MKSVALPVSDVVGTEISFMISGATSDIIKYVTKGNVQSV